MDKQQTCRGDATQELAAGAPGGARQARARSAGARARRAPLLHKSRAPACASHWGSLSRVFFLKGLITHEEQRTHEHPSLPLCEMPAPLATPQAIRRVGHRDVDGRPPERIFSQPTLWHGYALSWTSLFLSCVACTGSLAVSLRSRSMAALGFSFSCAVGVASSTLVLWRFWAGQPSHVLELREQRASVGMSFLFVVLAVAIGTPAAMSLKDHRREDVHPELLTALEITGVAVFCVLGLAKLWIAQALDSTALRKDGACSFCGAALAFGALAGRVAEKYDARMWFLDSLIALAACGALLSCGCFSLASIAIKHRRWCFPIRSANNNQKGGMGKESVATPASTASFRTRALVSPIGTRIDFDVAAFTSPPPRVGAICIAVGSGAMRSATPSTTSTSSGSEVSPIAEALPAADDWI
jgi:hypothetical protein